ncbi:hypothetical protein BH09VER1_BH09VER1_51700 [soil metagenome]
MQAFHTQGSARTRGRQQAEACGEKALGIYENALRVLSGGPAAQQRESALRWLEQAARVLPDCVKEASGVAEGLGIPLADYARAIFSWRYSNFMPACSTFGLRDQEGRIWIGKTDDVLESEIGMNVMQKASPAEGYDHIKFHPAGTTFVSSGMNCEGLIVALTGVPGPAAEVGGVPALWLVDDLLCHCATVEEGLDRARSVPINVYGASLLLADKQGNWTLIEKNFFGTVELPPHDGSWHAHTNHLLDPGLRGQSPQPSEDLAKNSHTRYLTLLALLSQADGPPEYGEKILQYEGELGTIAQGPGAHLQTDYAILAEPSQGLLRLWPGCPRQVDSIVISKI